jgi:hypothetical protein
MRNFLAAAFVLVCAQAIAADLDADLKAGDKLLDALPAPAAGFSKTLYTEAFVNGESAGYGMMTLAEKPADGKPGYVVNRMMTMRMPKGSMTVQETGFLTQKFQLISVTFSMTAAADDGTKRTQSTTTTVNGAKIKHMKTINEKTTIEELDLPKEGCAASLQWIFQFVKLDGMNSVAFREVSESESKIKNKQFTLSRQPDGSMKYTDDLGEFYVLAKDGTLVSNGRAPIEERTVTKARADQVKAALERGTPQAQASGPRVIRDAFAGGRYVEKAGGYSFMPPEGWNILEVPGQKYRIAAGPPKNGFSPNIVFADEEYAGTLPEYVALAEGLFVKLFKGYKKISLADFPTDSKAPAKRLIMENEQSGRHVRQICYFFNGTDGKKIAAFGTVLTEMGTGYDEAFDGSLKTFRAGSVAALAAESIATGGAAPVPAPPSKPAPPPPPEKTTRTYILKDGTRVIAKQFIESEDSVTLRDDTGKPRIIKKSEIEKVE